MNVPIPQAEKSRYHIRQAVPQQVTFTLISPLAIRTQTSLETDLRVQGTTQSSFREDPLFYKETYPLNSAECEGSRTWLYQILKPASRCQRSNPTTGHLPKCWTTPANERCVASTGLTTNTNVYEAFNSPTVGLKAPSPSKCRRMKASRPASI